MAIRLIIADDHPLMAEGIANTFDQVDDIQVKAVVSNGQEALDLIKDELYDIALLDVDMPVMDGIECAKQIVRDFSDVKVAILSMHQEASVIKHLMDLGVKGYMLKTIPQNELILAVQSIYNGNYYFNDSVMEVLNSPEDNEKVVTIIEKSPLLNELTSREMEILKLIAKGMTNVQIADSLFISPRTADTHRTNIMNKLDTRNVAGLVRFAFQNGLV